jgi:hypothetical protein
MFPLAVAVHSNLLTETSTTSIILLALAILIGLIMVAHAQRASLRAVRALVRHFGASSAMALAYSAIACSRSFWEVARVTAAVAAVICLVRAFAAAAATAAVAIATAVAAAIAIAAAIAVAATAIVIAIVVITEFSLLFPKAPTRALLLTLLITSVRL